MLNIVKDPQSEAQGDTAGVRGLHALQDLAPNYFAHCFVIVATLRERPCKHYLVRNGPAITPAKTRKGDAQ